MQNIVTLGADPSGVGFSDTAIAAAISAGQGVYIPSGKYRVAGGFTLTTPQTVMGDGATSILAPDNSFPAISNLFHVMPGASPWPRGFNFRHFQVQPQTPGLGGSAIFYDTNAPGSNLAGSVVEDVSIWQMGGTAILGLNTGPNGPWSIKIRDCLLQGGVGLLECGDTCAIQDCDITGAGIGIQCSFAVGAAAMVIRGCNITSKGGAINLIGVSNCVIEDTECETPGGYSGAIPALVYILNCSDIALSRLKLNATMVTSCVRFSGSNACQITGPALFTSAHPYFHISDQQAAGINSWTGVEYLDGAVGGAVPGYIHTGS
jgi:pectate lyase-like protein